MTNNSSKSVLIRQGIYASTIFEMEFWSRLNNFDYTEEEYLRQLDLDECMDCGLRRENVGLFDSKERAFDILDMLHEDSYEKDRELYCAFIREKAKNWFMARHEYIQEWTYVQCLLHDESIVRNYAEWENRFYGRPKEKIHFQRGDIIMIPERHKGHWGIVYDTPQEYKGGDDKVAMTWMDDSYDVIVCGKDNNYCHEYVLAHRALPTLSVPMYVYQRLTEWLEEVENR